MQINNDKGILQSGLFYFDHLSLDKSEDIEAIKRFNIDTLEGKGLSVYLKEDSWREEISLEMRTYIVRFVKTDECVGYFSLKAGLISLNEVELEIQDDSTGEKYVEMDLIRCQG